jgi:hypothetical protein
MDDEILAPLQLRRVHRFKELQWCVVHGTEVQGGR